MGGTTRRHVLALIAGGVGLRGFFLRSVRAQTTDLIARMTLEEKIGQLTILSAYLTVTGPTIAGTVAEDVRAGRVGSLFNLWGRDSDQQIVAIDARECVGASPATQCAVE